MPQKAGMQTEWGNAHKALGALPEMWLMVSKGSEDGDVGRKVGITVGL